MRRSGFGDRGSVNLCKSTFRNDVMVLLWSTSLNGYWNDTVMNPGRLWQTSWEVMVLRTGRFCLIRFTINLSMQIIGLSYLTSQPGFENEGWGNSSQSIRLSDFWVFILLSTISSISVDTWYPRRSIDCFACVPLRPGIMQWLENEINTRIASV